MQFWLKQMKVQLLLKNKKLESKVRKILAGINLIETRDKLKDFFIIDSALEIYDIQDLLKQKKPILRLIKKGKEYKKLEFNYPEFYIYQRFYDTDNLDYVIKKFADHLKFQQIRKGKIIVIDGGDGSGKKTQSDLLVEYFKKKGEKVKLYDFPQYFGSIYGETIARFLNKEFGELDQISPEIISIVYAQDRQTVAEEIRQLLLQDTIIICNRYTSSSLAFQTVRKPPDQQMKFINWIIDLEYKTNLLPLEDLTIYLDVKTETSQKLIQKKKKRDYLKKQGYDLTEELTDYQRKTRKMYLYLCNLFRHWKRIKCIENNKLKSIKEVHQAIVDCVNSNLKLH